MFKTIATIAFLGLLGSAAPQAQQAPPQPDGDQAHAAAEGRRSRHQPGGDQRDRRDRAVLQDRPPHPSGRRMAQVVEGEFWFAPDGQPAEGAQGRRSLTVPDGAMHNEIRATRA